MAVVGFPAFFVPHSTARLPHLFAEAGGWFFSFRERVRDKISLYLKVWFVLSWSLAL
jgi:hypothetical protein